MKILIFTDSRGQHKPRGATHEMFAHKIANDNRFIVDMYLCPFKWTTTLDFLEKFSEEDLKKYDLVVLYTGIVDWSPRPVGDAINGLYNNSNIANLSNLKLNTDNYNQKVVNNKKSIFDSVFGEENIDRYFSRPFDTMYEGSKTLNMYSIEMAKKYLLPRLRAIPNLLFITSNKFCPGWDGDYWKKRPDNIYLTEAYSEVFSQELPTERTINLLKWSLDDVKRYTCDNLHLSEAGNEYLYQKIMQHINKNLGRSAIVKATENSMPVLKAPALTHKQLIKALSADELDLCKRTTLIIGARISDNDEVRVNNLKFLLQWLVKYYGDIFDVLLIEQDDKPRLLERIGDLPGFIRHQFLFNPYEYNRGWGYNVAVKHYCQKSDVVALMDTDVLTGDGFVECILACHQKYQAVSPYKNVYYTNEDEAAQICKDLSYSQLERPDGVKNPVTITGGVVIVKTSAFLDVYGFEQYIGYGCEDRALDVTLINRYGLDSLFLSNEIYIHLHHEPDRAARINFNKIYSHLTGWYGCKYDPKVQAHEYIHKNCNHSTLKITEALARIRSESFADVNLYGQGIDKLTSNGQSMKNFQQKDGALLPDLHEAISKSDFDGAVGICNIAIDRYQGSQILNLFLMKQDEIKRLVLKSKSSMALLPKRTSDTLVILGNGPSLKYVMANPVYREILKKYDTFGLNAAYRAYDELGFWPTYHGCLDMIVVESHLQNYRAILPKLRMMFLLSEDHLGNDIVGFEHPHLTKIRFDSKFRDSNEKTLSSKFDEFRNWQNSGCNCVQIGLMLGYERIVLLGMDANYKELLSEADITRDEKYRWDHLEITKEVKSNDNYWFSGYQQVGDKYNIPNADKYHLPAWNALGLSVHKEKIVNCTTETKITTIARRSFEEIFDVRPVYEYLNQECFIEAINVDLRNIVGNLVKIRGLIFYFAEQGDKVVRQFVSEKKLKEILQSAPETKLLVCDESYLDVPCHGVLDDLKEIVLNVLKPGLTFMVRAKNERQNIYFVLGSLKHVLSSSSLNCQLLFVDNMSTDKTYDEVVRVCREQGIRNVFLTKYEVEVSRSGDAHAALKKENTFRSLDTYYNWCLDRVMTNYVMKWDCDFLALQSNLIALIKEYELQSSDRPLAIWCSGKTLFKNGNQFFVNEETMYNEFRIFSKAQGYRWEYAPRWEICSREYMTKAEKHTFTPCVFLELKDLGRNEFEFRSQGAAIVSDTRDKRDAEIIAAIQSAREKKLPVSLTQLDFNPLVPAAFNAPALNTYEATLEELDAMQSYWLNVYSRPENYFRFKHKGNAVIQGLWVGEQITNFHRLCIESFIKNGHCYVLYTYGPVKNLPEGVVIKDANKIVPAALIYQYDGSYAGFSDLFRNRLLYANGGWYVDLDIFCLKPFDIESDIVFSMDHYHPETIKAKIGGNEIIDNKYYVQTNPCKLPVGHDVARDMYKFIFKKIIFDRLKKVWLGDKADAPQEWLKGEVPAKVVIQAIEKLGALADFEIFVGKLDQLPEKVSFYKLLELCKVSINDVGQKTWGEIGPIMITREVVTRGLQKYATKPEMFQGVIKYFEVEKFVDPNFDYESEIKNADSYSLDLFYTMWRRKGLLEKFDTDERCLLRHMRDLVARPLLQDAR